MKTNLLSLSMKSTCKMIQTQETNIRVFKDGKFCLKFFLDSDCGAEGEVRRDTFV